MPSLGFSAIEKVVESKVLLVFIQNKRGITISHEFLRSLFKNYGSVLKVFLIFNEFIFNVFCRYTYSKRQKCGKLLLKWALQWRLRMLY